LRRCEHGGGLFGDAGALEEVRVLRALQLDGVREGEGSEIGGDVAVGAEVLTSMDWKTPPA
jgi:hypothetical protein